MAFIDQVARDVKKELQKLESPQGKSLRELLKISVKIYQNRKTEEDKEEMKEK